MKFLLVAVLLTACGESKAPAPEPESAQKDPNQSATVTMTPEALKSAGVTIEPIVESDVVTSQELPGTIEAQSGALVIVNTRAAGVIETIHLDIGDRVKVGQQLATIRSLDLAEAQAAYRKAVVSDKYAASTLARSEGLKQDGVISQRRLEADQQQAREAKLGVEEAEKRIRILGGGLGDASGMFSITAPIAGVIAERKANRGEHVADGSPLFTIVDVSRILVQLKALGGTAVVPGKEVTFTVDAIADRTFKAIVKSSSDLIDPETRRFMIICSVENPDGVLKPGMFVTGHLASGGGRALTVPEAAIQIIEGKPTVFIEKAPGQFERRDVKLGAKAAGLVAVETGVKAGERVVVQGSFMVRTQMQKAELEE
jgi:cobalt-zinc-cadmium efflux system membrane fusion protein